jgi:hypothetical protein
MIAVREQDQSSAGADAKDDEVWIGNQHAACRRSPVVYRVHTRALNDGLHELFRCELTIVGLVGIRWVPELEVVIIVHCIGGAERVRKVFF